MPLDIKIPTWVSTAMVIGGGAWGLYGIYDKIRRRTKKADHMIVMSIAIVTTGAMMKSAGGPGGGSAKR